MAKVLILVYIAIVVFGGFRFLQSFKITDCIFELAVAIIVPILVLIFSRNMKKKTVFPMTLAGLAILPDRTKEAKIGRVKAYLLDSVKFAVVFAALNVGVDLINKYQNETLQFTNFGDIVNCGAIFLGDLALFFVVCFVMDYIIYEHKSKMYYKENAADEQ
jgi:hypothetical protein